MKKEVLKGMRLDIDIRLDGKLICEKTTVLTPSYQIPVCMLKTFIVGMLTEFANSITERKVRMGLCGLIHTTEEKGS